MPKNVSKKGSNWLVETMKHDKAGNLIYKPDGSLKKKKICMGDATFSDGTPQSLYFPDDHPMHPGILKGMLNILVEQGHDLDHVKKLPFECKGFKCSPPARDCCCCRLLFNEPDFTVVKSVLEMACDEQGVQVMFLPKFHCKLNPIEQCWGYAKRMYRLNPESSREDALEKNVLDALVSISIESM